MRMETWMASQPGIDRGGLVRAVVIHHQMDVQLGRHVGLDGAQELQEFAAAMTPRHLATTLPVAMSSAANSVVAP